MAIAVPTDRLAKTAAMRVLKLAQKRGYEPVSRNVEFVVRDLEALEGAIQAWIVRNMQRKEGE